MIYSMTGFGRGDSKNAQMEITVEIKTVNNRYCDIIFKMPKKFNSLEEKMKNKIKQKISRGRVEVYVNLVETSSDQLEVLPQFDVLDKYFNAYNLIAERYAIKDQLSLSHLLKVQDGISVNTSETDEAVYWESLNIALDQAIENLMIMRSKEGEALKRNLESKLLKIERLIQKLEKRSPEMLLAHKNKMIERVEQLLEDMKVSMDDNRLANELAIYADKTNIDEEIVRIRTHVQQISQMLTFKEPMGRKLDFLIQELNREINTIGSKSPDLEISNIVIELKSDIEQIREQVQNIE